MYHHVRQYYRSKPRYGALLTPPEIKHTMDFANLSPHDLKMHAMRMKYIDDTERSTKEHGLKLRLLHLSALSSDSRKSHTERHGKLFTFDEVRQFWAIPENVAGCKCSVSAALIDEAGNPLTPTILERARATYQKMKARGNGVWTQD